MTTAFRLAVTGLAILNLATVLVQAQYAYAYVTENNAITITSYSGPGGQELIPDNINGLPVRRIGDGAFYWCSSLTHITIPSSVTTIGNGAFYWCSSLTSVTILGNVHSIEDWTFENCPSLTNVTMPTASPTSENLPSNTAPA